MKNHGKLLKQNVNNIHSVNIKTTHMIAFLVKEVNFSVQLINYTLLHL